MWKKLLSLFMFAGSTGMAAPVTTNEPPRLVAGRYVIDVRSSAEWAQGHVEGAIHIPHDRIGSRIAAVIPDQSAPIALYCRSGRRAAAAERSLRDLGYLHVENLATLENARSVLQTTP